MRSWLATKLLTYLTRRRATMRPPLALYHPDVTLTFPGRNSWSGIFRGKAEVADWLRRFETVGLQLLPDEVVVKGMPWNTTLCIRGRDHLDTPEGDRVYENRFVIWGHLKWGRLRDYEVYEDTHKPEDLDAYLRQRRPSLIAT